jgi:hypothetical protein
MLSRCGGRARSRQEEGVQDDQVKGETEGASAHEASAVSKTWRGRTTIVHCRHTPHRGEGDDECEAFPLSYLRVIRCGDAREDAGKGDAHRTGGRASTTRFAHWRGQHLPLRSVEDCDHEDADELRGRDELTRSAPPAQQGLNADDALRSQIDLRLKVQQEFVPRQRAVQLVLHPQPLAYSLRRVRRWSLDRLSCPLDAVHRTVGMPEQVLCSRTILWEHRDTHARARGERLIVDPHGPREGLRQTRRYVHRPCTAVDSGQEHSELVSAQARCGRAARAQ